jgi:hypothetical protein
MLFGSLFRSQNIKVYKTKNSEFVFQKLSLSFIKHRAFMMYGESVGELYMFSTSAHRAPLMVSSRPGFFIVGKSHAYLLDKIDHIAGIA